MSHGLQKVYACTMASGGTMSAELDLQRSYRNVYLVIPTMATASNGMQIFISDVASSAGGTYRPLMHSALNSSTVALNTYIIASTATNCVVPVVTSPGLRYFKVNTNATVQDGCVFKFLCGD